MNITILNKELSTVPTAKGSYQQLEVAYKNLTFNKVESKKLFSFGAGASAFKTLSEANVGDSFSVETNKNDKGYIDWVSVTKGIKEAYAENAPKATATAAPRSNFETPEERAKRQVYIIRQSSVASAIALLSVGAKNLDLDKVLDVSRKIEAHVLGTGATGFDDLPNVDNPEMFGMPEVQ